MLIQIFDAINSVLQVFIFMYCCNEILNKENKISKIKFFIATLLMFFIVEIFTYSGINMTIANILILILCIVTLIITIKKVNVALIGFAMGYFLVTITSYVIGNIYYCMTSKINISINSDLKIILLLYIPAMLLYIPIYMYRKYPIEFGVKLINIKNSVVVGIILDVSLILFNTIYMNWFYGKLNSFSRAILYGTIFSCFIVIAIYFSIVYSKAKEIERLNNALEEKITELRKIKHDYGSQISVLFNLAQTNKFVRVTEILQSIIQQNNQISSTIELQATSSPLLLALLKNANSLGINTIIDNSTGLEKIGVDILDFTTVIGNIVNNAIPFVKDKKDGYIKISIKEEDDYFDISIENNGEKISSNIINKIFDEGYTTKTDNKSEHGFGLSKCKQIIERYNGTIQVESNKQATRFIIKLPIN